jgi:ribosome modulation factor
VLHLARDRLLLAQMRGYQKDVRERLKKTKAEKKRR